MDSSRSPTPSHPQPPTHGPHKDHKAPSTPPGSLILPTDHRTRPRRRLFTPSVPLRPPPNSTQTDLSLSLSLSAVKSHTLLAQQDYELAQRFLTRLLSIEPSNAEARELIGVCELELGNPQEARDVCPLSLSLSFSSHLPLFILI